MTTAFKSKTAALEYAAEGIRVNAVGTGYIGTPLLSALDEKTYNGRVGLHRSTGWAARMRSRNSPCSFCPSEPRSSPGAII